MFSHSMKSKSLVQGFSLVEMAIVLVILGFVMGTLLLPLQAQRQQLAQSQTENTLETAKKALLGYAQSRGRLPCPATANGNVDAGSEGIEQPQLVTGTCTKTAGYLPAATLGIQPTDQYGFAVDAWNNRIRYAVTQGVVDEKAQTIAINYTFTTSNGMSDSDLTTLTTTQKPSLRVCQNASPSALTCSMPIDIPANVYETNYLIKDAVVVVYSLGPSGSNTSGGSDEDANLNNDNVFVSHEPSALNSANGEFDHLMVWISPNVLYNAMIEAGQLH